MIKQRVTLTSHHHHQQQCTW